MRCAAIAWSVIVLHTACCVAAGDDWRPLPLIRDGKVDPGWAQIGWGKFVVDGEALRTECDPRGMGLLLYTKERFGDCQIRVVYKAKDARSNAGVFIRIDDGILEKLGEKTPAVERNPSRGLAPGALEKLQEASERRLGPWYAVHHGYEVQICDEADEYHRTGAIYSLAKAARAADRKPGEWRVMIITLRGSQVLVDLDGARVTDFDSERGDVPARRQWYEPDRGPKRPNAGYIGLQNHDPGDVVYFRAVSVRGLD